MSCEISSTENCEYTLSIRNFNIHKFGFGIGFENIIFSTQSEENLDQTYFVHVKTESSSPNTEKTIKLTPVKILKLTLYLKVRIYFSVNYYG